jgi:5-methyltetrahydrofolate--homocysteine methyltransferase
MRYFDTLHNARALRKAQTDAESIFWNRVRNRKFMGLKFNRQYIIEYAQILGNKLYYIADFHNHEFKTIIEIDGPIHLEQQAYDKERSTNIEALGFKILRFMNDEVLYQWEEVEKKLAKHFYSPPAPLSGERGYAQDQFW